MIIAPTHHSSRFHWEAPTRTFVAEASDFGPGREHPRIWDQAFDDAVDEGFRIRSAQTGREVLFTLVREERDNEGDVLAWHFESYQTPTLLHAVILND